MFVYLFVWWRTKHKSERPPVNDTYPSYLRSEHNLYENFVSGHLDVLLQVVSSLHLSQSPRKVHWTKGIRVVRLTFKFAINHLNEQYINNLKWLKYNRISIKGVYSSPKNNHTISRWVDSKKVYVPLRRPLFVSLRETEKLTLRSMTVWVFQELSHKTHFYVSLRTCI